MPESESFHWRDSHARLAELARDRSLELAEDGDSFQVIDQAGCRSLIFRPPLLQAIRGRSAECYLRDQESPGRHILILIQAGISAIGLWQDDDLLRHKVIRKYVVRGRGRAQPLHLKTRGKSRYGSRLRLQQAKQQLIDTNEKLLEFWEETAPPAGIFYSAPVRIWPELFASTPKPPFDRKDSRLQKIPIHVHRPDFAELERIHRILSRGRIEALSSDS